MSEPKWRNDIKENYKTKVTHLDNCTVTVHRPTNLTDVERRTIEDQIRISMLNMIAEKDTNARGESA